VSACGGASARVMSARALVQVLGAPAPPASGPSGWNAPIDRAGEALRDGDVAQALAWWHEARREALRSGTWEAMVDVGDASRRLAAGGGFRREGDARAREAYMNAPPRR